MSLSEQEREEIHSALWETGCMGFADDHPGLFAAVARIVRAHAERAWDEGWLAAQEVVDFEGRKVWAHTVFPEGYEGNPYRQEADR